MTKIALKLVQRQMYMKRLWLIFILMAWALTPVIAQDDTEEATLSPEEEMLTTVTSILEDMAALSAFRVDGDLTVRQTIQTGGTSVATAFVQDIDLQLARSGDTVDHLRADLQQTINLGMGIGSGGFSMELLLPSADDHFYARLGNFSGLMLELTGTEWVVIGSESPEADFVNEAFPSPAALLASFSRVLDYPITEDTVLAVRERRAQNIRYERHEYPTRRIEIEFNVAALLELGVLDTELRAVDAPALGLSNAELIDALIDGASLVVNFYVDEETGLFRRIETQFSYDSRFTAHGEEIRLQQTSEARFTYSRFNEEFTVTAPDDFIE
jgi:hypothetical protein